MADAHDHRHDDRLCALLFRAQKLLAGHARPRSRPRHFEDEPRRLPHPERPDLRLLALRQRHSGRPDERPLVHGRGSCAVRPGQLRVRLRRGHLLLDHGTARRQPVHQHADSLHGRHVGRQRPVAGNGIPALRASADPLDSAHGAGDQDVGVEYLAFDRCGPRGDPLRLCHGDAGNRYDGRSRRRGVHRRQPGRGARRCRGDGAGDGLRRARRRVEMVLLDSFGHRFRRSHRAGRLPA